MTVGLDLLRDHAALLRGSRFGVLAHPASVDSNLTHIRSVLGALGLTPTILFGPEHGYGGEAQDMISVGDARDPDGVPIRSLYGDTFADLIPRDEDLKGLDWLVIDLQDIGARYYTFVWTAVLALRACARLGVRTLVLDRPNPLNSPRTTSMGSRVIEGAFPTDPTFLSFVGLEPVPIRHGLTLGEICEWRRVVERLPKEVLKVVSAGQPTGEETSARFVLPSPNMPTMDTVRVYPGGCLLEGTNLSEGRGTTKPFEIFGAPWLDGVRLARELEATRLPDFRARPLTFHPTFHKHAHKLCGGIQIHVTGPGFRPVATYAAAIALCQRQAPDAFQFRTEKYEFRDDVPAIDLLFGSDAPRKHMLAGGKPGEIAEQASQVDLSQYREILSALASK